MFYKIKKISFLKQINIYCFILLTFIISSCTVLPMKIGVNLENTLKDISLNYKDLDSLIVVNIKSQELLLLKNGEVKAKYII